MEIENGMLRPCYAQPPIRSFWSTLAVKTTLNYCQFRSNHRQMWKELKCSEIKRVWYCVNYIVMLLA